MAFYFFDSSALLKRYVREAGTVWVRSVVDSSSGNTIYAARITWVEMTSAIARRTKGRLIRPKGGSSLIAAVRHDVSTQYRVVEVDSASVSLAVEIAARRALRAYDAVQLALGLTVASERAAENLPPVTFVSADRDLNAAAANKGLIVDDPNDHP